MKVYIYSPYSLETAKGNTVTAKRLVQGLTGEGIEALAIHQQEIVNPDALIALNAIKSADRILDFARHHPSAQLHVYLTGTDIHGGIQREPELATQVFEVASSLVVAHPECIDEIPEAYHGKVVVIYPGCLLPKELPVVEQDGEVLFSCLGHLREVKNPLLMARSLEKIQQPCRAVLLGDLLEENLRQEVEQAMLDKRFEWRSGVAREEALAWMGASLATLNTSFLEGGANTVIEAVLLGVPVLASDIAGNRGLLGREYAGLFPSDDAAALARLMQKCMQEPSFLAELKDQLKQREPLFSLESERRAWHSLLMQKGK